MTPYRSSGHAAFRIRQEQLTCHEEASQDLPLTQQWTVGPALLCEAVSAIRLDYTLQT